VTALLLYMGEIKHHSDQLVPASGDRAYLQRVVETRWRRPSAFAAWSSSLPVLTGGLPAPSAAESAS
jgi:hypothetical protein